MDSLQDHRKSGFSILETVAVVAVIGIVAMIGLVLASKVRPSAYHAQVRSNVSQLNASIKIYLNSGGTLDGLTAGDAATVLQRLQTRMTEDDANTFVGFTGSTIDSRLQAVEFSSSQTGARAVYNPDKKRFELTNSGVAGYRFEMGPPVDAQPEESREQGMFEYANNSTWIWDYADSSKATPPSPLLASTTPETTSIPVSVLDAPQPEAAEPGVLRKLLPPISSLPDGTFGLSDFPMSLELRNPNEVGKIIYGVVNADDWQWFEYTGPILVNPGTEIVAYIESWRPQVYHNSSTTRAFYNWYHYLSSPWFDVVGNPISQDGGVSTVTIHEQNDASLYESYGIQLPPNPFEVKYRIVPLVSGDGTETGWISYTGPFDVEADQFPSGFKVLAKVTSPEPGLYDSWIEETTVTTYDPDATSAPELEFTESAIHLQVGDVLTIRDYVQVKDDPTATPDWSEVYFTYTAAGANDPTSPVDWNLSNFNNGYDVNIVEADVMAGTGNGGDGVYRVYLVRNGEPDFDDYATISITDPNNPGSGLPKLLPPEFSIPSGYYEGSSFPLSLVLTDPNPSGQGKIVYTIGDVSADYTGPISVDPNTDVIALVESLDPSTHQNSDSLIQSYHESVEPSGPWVWVSDSEIEVQSGSANIYIGFDNTSHISYQIQYKLIPTVPGEGVETDWANYTGWFSVGGPQFPRGFDVTAKIVPTDSSYSEVPGETETVAVYQLLEPPTIESDVNAITEKDPIANITLTDDINPAGSSHMEYQIQDFAGNVQTDWTVYNSPFVIDGADYPDGVRIVAKSLPDDPYYRESMEVSKAISATFFDIEVTWKTIFVLDSSGSMITNDRMARLQEQVLGVLNEFGEEDSFAIIDYDDGATVLAGWGPGSETRKQDAIAAVNNMTADGATNYHAGLQSAIDLSASDATQVIFLSDGLPFNPDASDPESTDGILDLVDTIVSGGTVRVDTVALGVNSDILQQMADHGNGEMVLIND